MGEIGLTLPMKKETASIVEAGSPVCRSADWKI